MGKTGQYGRRVMINEQTVGDKTRKKKKFHIWDKE